MEDFSWIIWVVVLALGIGILVAFLVRSAAVERDQAEAAMQRAVLIQEHLEQERQQIEAERRELEQIRRRIRETSDR